MGGEIGQWNEWSCKGEVEWELMQFPAHQGVNLMVRDLNHLYVMQKALWERDFDYNTFEWVDFSDVNNSVISYLRKGFDTYLLCVHNFTPTYYRDYVVRLGNVTFIEEIFNSDMEKYGGSGKVNVSPHIMINHQGVREAVSIQLAPLATMIFRVRFT